MNASTPLSTSTGFSESSESSQAESAVVDSTHWAATVTGEAEPALLARLLQRLLCQNAEIISLRYDVVSHRRQGRMEVVFSLDASRAHLLARRWRTLVTVASVELRPAMFAR